MSVRVMSKAWDCDVPTTDKMVLLALADWSDDEGCCWPSIARLCRKSGLSERAVQGALNRLESGKHLSRDLKPGKGTIYAIHPRTTCTPADAAPPHVVRQTPARRAPNTLIHVNTSEAKASSVAHADAQTSFPRPEGVDRQVWADFLANRKLRRLKNTATAYKSLMNDAAKLTNEKWSLAKLIEHAAGKGWGAIYDPGNRARPPDGTSSNAGLYAAAARLAA